MKLNDFEVVIPEGDETEVGYVCLMHGTQYSIKLRNHSERLRCNATVKIDGRSVGTWRVDLREAITIERPVHDSGRFTFYQGGSHEAAKANIRPTDELGLISVLFWPEKSQDGPPVQCMAAPRPYAAGGTGLSGKSAQQFDEADEIEIDDERAVTIHLRLVAIQNEPRPLFALETPIPPAMQYWIDDSSGSDKISKLIRSPAQSRLSWKLASLGGCLLIAYIAYLHFSIRTHHGNATHEPIFASMADDQIPVPQSVSQSPEAMFKRAKSENNEHSFSFYSNAAERGHAPSQVELGLYYVLGKPPVEKDFDKGIKLIESAAKGGCLEAQVTLGEILTQTQSTSSNRAEGRKWLYEAADRGDLKALYLIGSLYDAHTTDNDGVLSFSRMRIAINKGYSGSLERYASIASNMSEADKCLAVELEEKAMKLGVQQWSLNWLESEREKQVQQLSVQAVQNADTSSRWTPVLKDWVTSEGKVIRALFVDLQDNGVVLELPGTGGRIYRSLSRLSLKSQEQAKTDQLAKNGVVSATNIPLPPDTKGPTTTSAFGGAIKLPVPSNSEQMTHLPTDQRLSSGALLVDRLAGRNRYGELEVVNGLSEDALVKLISNERLAVSFYVRGGETFKLASIPDGSYSLLYCTGFGWSQQNRDFSRGRHASRHDKTLQFTTEESVEGRQVKIYGSKISLTLHKVVSGNTTTSEVSLEEFDKYD